MARGTDKRRAELRERLIDIAEAEIRESGLGALRARSVAEKAGCAVGAIYNVFDDLTGLSLAVNMRTFARLGARVQGAVEGMDDAPPTERLLLMADAYVDFASEELNLWRALFTIGITDETGLPQWYLDEFNRLFGAIARPFAALDPDASEEEILLRTKALFSAVHGMMLLSFERRLSSVPREHLKRMVGYLLRKFVS